METILDAFFGFLHRKTDFYVQFEASELKNAEMGFPKGKAEAMLLQSFKKFPYKEYEELQQHRYKAQPPCIPSDDINNNNGTKNNSPSPSSPSSSQQKRDKPLKKPTCTRLNEKGQQYPIGNGGVGPNYSWTQTLSDLTIYVDAHSSNQNLNCIGEIGGEIRAKDIFCDISAKKMCLKVKGTLLLSGEFEYNVNVSESIWSINRSKSKQSSYHNQIT